MLFQNTIPCPHSHSVPSTPCSLPEGHWIAQFNCPAQDAMNLLSILAKYLRVFCLGSLTSNFAMLNKVTKGW